MSGSLKKASAISPKSKISLKRKDSPSKEESPSKKGSPAKKGSPEKEIDAATQALNHVAQGKRHLLVSDIDSAVNSLQEACRMLAEQHGETATECGDAYFYYGRALLEMSRIESCVLGNALDGVPEGEDDIENSQVENPDSLPVEEKEKVAEQVGEALEDNFIFLEKPSPTKDSKSDEPMEDKTSDTKAEDKDESPDKDVKADSMDTDSEMKGNTEDESQDESQDDQSQDDESQEEDVKEKEGDKTEDADDVDSLQLAWEMLELAKVIYQRQAEGDKAMSLKTAQVLLKLGEVCLENENFPQSIEDFQSCLKIQETHMEADDRCLAETHYQLGVALSFSDDFDKAIERFTKTIKIIEDRIANLTKKKTDKAGWTKEQKKKDAESKEESSSNDDKEIEELKNLIPEIKGKIADMEEVKKDTKDKINKVKKELGMASAIGGPSSSDAKIIDPTMIKKKRKPEDETDADASKKTKAVNGEESSGKGVKNGNSSPEKMDTDKESKNVSKDELKKKAVGDMKQKTKELKKQAA